jgi:hypothetical protein
VVWKEFVLSKNQITENMESNSGVAQWPMAVPNPVVLKTWSSMGFQFELKVTGFDPKKKKVSGCTYYKNQYNCFFYQDTKLLKESSESLMLTVLCLKASAF